MCERKPEALRNCRFLFSCCMLESDSARGDLPAKIKCQADGERWVGPGLLGPDFRLEFRVWGLGHKYAQD